MFFLLFSGILINKKINKKGSHLLPGIPFALASTHIFIGIPNLCLQKISEKNLWLLEFELLISGGIGNPPCPVPVFYFVFEASQLGQGVGWEHPGDDKFFGNFN